MKVNRGLGRNGWDWEDYLWAPAALSVHIEQNLNQPVLHPRMTKIGAAIVGWRAKINGEGYSGGGAGDLVKLFKEDLPKKYGNKYILMHVPNLEELSYFLKRHYSEDDTFYVDKRGLGVLRIGCVELRDPKYLFEDWEMINNAEEDIDCIYGFAKWYWDNVVEPRFIPLTTQQVIKKRIKANMTNKDKAFVRTLVPYYESTYKEAMQYLFIGAYQGCLQTIELKEHVGHVDFKSSYSARLMLDYFPMSAFEEADIEDLEKCLRTKCCQVYCTLYNVHASSIRFIGKKRIKSFVNAEFDAQLRLVNADKIELILTELDFDLLRKFYKFDSITIDELWVADRGPLPKYVRDVVADCYASKEMAERGSVDRAWAKICSEMCYGTTVKAVYKRKDESWKDIREKKLYLSPYWGIWCVSHARYALLTTAMQLGQDFIYAHTDSLYYTNPVFHVQVIEEYNRNQENKVFRYCTENGLDFNIFKNLGKFAYEDGADATHPTIVRFKAIGPGQYIYTFINDDNERELVVKAAGYIKQWVKDDKEMSIWEYTFTEEEDLYLNFEQGVKIKDLQKYIIPKNEPCTLIYDGKVYTSETYAIIGYKWTRSDFKDRLIERREAEAKLRGEQYDAGKEQRNVIELI